MAWSNIGGGGGENVKAEVEEYTNLVDEFEGLITDFVGLPEGADGMTYRQLSLFDDEGKLCAGGSVK